MVKSYPCIGIVVRRDSMDRVDPNTSQKFIEENNLQPEYYDKHIISILGGMGPPDVEAKVRYLEKTYNLIFNPNPKTSPCTDIVIVSDLSGVYTINTWLKEYCFARHVRLPRYYYFDEK